MIIRNPDPSDVLCGRGGGINAHEGNVAFRELVQDQKAQYNLAANKNEKAEISQDIVDHVNSRGGRFLQRDESQPFSSAGKNTGWWIEIDNMKAIAKTSQALREGAPRIRASAAKKTTKKPAEKRIKRERKSTTASLGSRTSDHSLPAQENEESAEEDEDVVHPLIRGYHDGIHRGKQLIPIQFLAKKARTENPQLEPIAYPENAPTPPPPGKSYGQGAMITPTLLSTPHPTIEVGKLSLPRHITSPQLNRVSEDAGTLHSSLPATLTVMDPASSSFADLAKPEISCARLHSLSEISGTEEFRIGEDFRGDESFANPFENEERLLKQQAALASSSAARNDLDSSDPSISSINKILRSKSSEYRGKKRSMDATGTSTPKAKSSPRREQSLRSFMSDLSDIPDSHEEEAQDFHEGLKKVYDAAYPGFTSPKAGEQIPTHLIPYKVLKGSPFRRYPKN